MAHVRERSQQRRARRLEFCMLRGLIAAWLACCCMAGGISIYYLVWIIFKMCLFTTGSPKFKTPFGVGCGGVHGHEGQFRSGGGTWRNGERWNMGGGGGGVRQSHRAWIRRLVPGFRTHHAQGGKGQILHSICHLLCRLDGEFSDSAPARVNSKPWWMVFKYLQNISRVIRWIGRTDVPAVMSDKWSLSLKSGHLINVKRGDVPSFTFG